MRCLSSMTEIKQTEESPQAVPVERPAETALPAEPAHSPVERVTETKAKDPKQVATQRAGAAARQKQLVEQLQAAKESLRPPVNAADNDGTSAPPKEAKPPKRTDERPEHNHNWIPWIKGACLEGVHLCMSLRASPAETCACAPVTRRWRQAPRSKSKINLPN